MRKILFHGTNNKDEILRYGLNSSSGLYGDGFYFYESSSSAKTYGKQIVRATVNISKPFTFKNKTEKEVYNKLYAKSGSHRDVIESLKRIGYDSFRFKDFSKNSVGFWAWNVFYPKNILSLK